MDASAGAGVDDNDNASDDEYENDDADMDPVVTAAERSHELLNKIEEALDKATRFMEDHPSGLISTPTKQRHAIDSTFNL